MFIRKYGKSAFFRVHHRLHEAHDFKKTQEILSESMEEGFRLLEACWQSIN